MSSLTVAALLQISLAASGSQNYHKAYRQTNDTGRPLVVMVGADWCPACVQMKKSVMPQVKNSGVLRQVSYAYINTDHDPALAQELTGGGSIPQLIVYRKTRRGWLRRRIIGARSAPEVQVFIQQQATSQKRAQIASQPPSAKEQSRTSAPVRYSSRTQ